MLHKCKMTILDKKTYPELQEAYCDPQSGPCPCYHVGDQYLFERYDGADDFWKMGAGTLIKATHGIDGVAGGPGRPHCSELWDAVSRYIYTALQGGSIMRGWMKDERVMIACCSDGTRPVIVKLERLDYCAAYLEGSRSREDDLRIAAALQEIPAVQEIIIPPRPSSARSCRTTSSPTRTATPPRLRSAKTSTPSSPIGPAGARTARRSSPTCPSCFRFWTNMKMCSGTWSTAPTVWTTPSPPLPLI